MASPSVPSTQRSDYGDAYPSSKKVYVEEGRVRVPMREVTLSDGEPAVRLYDTSGPARRRSPSGTSRGPAGVDRRAWRRRAGARCGRGSRVGARGAPPTRPARAGGGHPAPLRAAGRGHRGDGVHRGPGGARPRVRALRGRPRARHHPGQHQPPRAGADDYRTALPREDQREHRQLRRQLVDRGGGREAAVGHPLGRGHGRWTCRPGTTSTRLASGFSGTRRCRSARSRSTRRSRRSAVGPRS